MDWSVELVGEALDIEAFKQFESVCNVVIAPDPDGQNCLGGPKLRGIGEVGQMRTVAAKALAELNGLARLENQGHLKVCLGSGAMLWRADGSIDRYVTLAGVEARTAPGTIGYTFEPPSTERRQPRKSTDPRMADWLRLVSDPKLVSVLECLGEDPTWPLLRATLERVLHAMGKKPNSHNTLLKYATQKEVDSFLANTRDPRIGGKDAVHGVPKKYPVKGEKWTKRQGVEFICRVLKAYLERTRLGQ